MKITKLETIRIEERPNLLWLHVHTDKGIIGLGGASIGPNSAWPATRTPPSIELAITPPSEYTTEFLTSIPGSSQ